MDKIIEFNRIMKAKLLIYFVLLTFVSFAQNESYPQYPNPVKIPVSLSATFAELRSNAFHAELTSGRRALKVKRSLQSQMAM